MTGFAALSGALAYSCIAVWIMGWLKGEGESPDPDFDLHFVISWLWPISLLTVALRLCIFSPIYEWGKKVGSK